MKKILHVLFLITLVSTFAVKTEEIDESFDIIQPEDYADQNEREKAEIERLNQEVHKSQPISKPEKTDLGVQATPKPGFFDRIRNWANKRTLSKKFTEHAKNSNTGNFDFSDATTKKMWGSLGKQDQIDLVKEWSDTRSKTIEKDLNKNRKKYENDLKLYEANDKKRRLATVDSAHEEIKKLDKKIASLEAELTKTTSITRKNTLNEEIQENNILKKAQEEVEKSALKSITNELNTREETYINSKNSIRATHEKNMQNFVNSITNEEGSLIRAKVGKQSEKTTQPTAKPTTVTVNPTTRQPEVPDEPNDAALTEAEIKNLTDQELAQKLDEIAAKYPGSHNNDPEYKKLQDEEKLRIERNNPTKSTRSVLDELGWKPTTSEPKVTNATSSKPSSEDENIDLNYVKNNTGTWSYDEIEKAIGSGKYSSTAKAFLISKLPEDRRPKKI